MNSTHKVEVVRIKLLPHGNADSLSVVPVYGYECIVRTSDWKDGDLAAYIPPDNLVDTTRPCFSFLKPDRADNRYRVRAQKLRGRWSQGLLVPVPPGVTEGDDVTQLLGVQHYEPPVAGEKVQGISLGGDSERGPETPIYDLESWRRYGHLFLELPEDPCMEITEKIHGAGARYTWQNDRLYCGSRRTWKREYPCYDHFNWDDLIPKMGEEKVLALKERLLNGRKQKNIWWSVLENYPNLVEVFKSYPGHIFYGELYGDVQDMRYGHKDKQASLAFFDVYHPEGYFLNYQQLIPIRTLSSVPWVPTLYLGPTCKDTVLKLTDGPSEVPGADHLREGVVVKPVVKEYYDARVGRLAFKSVSNEYLNRK